MFLVANLPFFAQWWVAGLLRSGKMGGIPLIPNGAYYTPQTLNLPYITGGLTHQ